MIALLGWLGSGLVVMSLIQRDIRRLRQLNLAASAALGIFNLALGIVSMIVLNLVLAGVNAYHLVKASAADRQAPPTAPTEETAVAARRAARASRCTESRIALEHVRT